MDIDAEKFGMTVQQVSDLQRQIEEIKAKQAEMGEQLAIVVGAVQRARGGWFVMITIGALVVGLAESVHFLMATLSNWKAHP